MSMISKDSPLNSPIYNQCFLLRPNELGAAIIGPEEEVCYLHNILRNINS